MHKNETTENWFRTDELDELYSTAKFVNDQVLTIDSNNDWRWAIIGGALLLQSTCVCALYYSHTASTFYYTDNAMMEWSNYYNDRNNHNAIPPKNSKLASTKTLLKRCKENTFFPQSVNVNISENQYQDSLKIIDFRNEFIHLIQRVGLLKLQASPEYYYGLPKYVQS